MATKTPAAVRVSASAETAEKRAPQSFDFDGLPVDELLRLRGEIDTRLPALSLSSMNVEKELVLHYLSAQALQAGVSADTPANQRAQVLNSVAASIAALAKHQAEVHSSERIKRVEMVLIDAVNLLPAEAKEAFLSAYEELLKKL